MCSNGNSASISPFLVSLSLLVWIVAWTTMTSVALKLDFTPHGTLVTLITGYAYTESTVSPSRHACSSQFVYNSTLQSRGVQITPVATLCCLSSLQWKENYFREGELFPVCLGHLLQPACMRICGTELPVELACYPTQRWHCTLYSPDSFVTPSRKRAATTQIST